MSRIPDDIPSRAGSSNLVRALSAARSLPVEAIDRAVREPGRIRADVIAAVEAAASGEQLDPAGENLLFWGIHVLAQARDTSLFGPLLRLLRRDEDELEVILGDVITETLPRVLASLYDGDADGLEAALLDPAMADFGRFGLFQAATFLTVEGRFPRDRTLSLLRRFETERVARAGAACWAGWEEAVALLGASDLRDAVEGARNDGRLLDDFNGQDWFEATLADAVARPDDRTRFPAESHGYVTDAVAELDTMLARTEGEPDAEAPVRNPLRDVGRNDPCPCGSGRKYKKCCLAA